MLRRLVPDHRELLLADESELRWRIPADLTKTIRLNEWHHPDGELPSESTAFGQLADVLTTGDSAPTTTPPPLRSSRSAAFAVESIRRRWTATGHSDYPHATRLLITADAGGSNGYRTRAWKAELAALALQTGPGITVGHFPPGTSKWNKVEHRLFAHITMNWRGWPLASHEVIVQTIAATTTPTGLRTPTRHPRRALQPRHGRRHQSPSAHPTIVLMIGSPN